MFRSWAQVAGAGVSTPSPLRQSITIPASPSTSPPRPCPTGTPGVSGGVLPPAGGLDALHDGAAAGGGATAAGAGGGGDSLALNNHNELAQGVQYTWAEEEEVAPISPGSNTSSSSSSTTTSTNKNNNNNNNSRSNNNNNTNDSNMVNAKRMEKLADKARAAAAAVEAAELPLGATAPAAEPAKAAASCSVAGARKKRKDEKAKARREEKGKYNKVEGSPSDEDEAPGGTSTEVITPDEAAAEAAESKEEALKRAMLASLERARRRELYGAKDGYDLIIEFAKDGFQAKLHRDVIVAESTWFAERLPPADENGMTFYVLSEWASNMMSPIIMFIYTGVSPGCNLNTTYKWDLRFVQFAVTTYRPAAALGVQSVMKHLLGNIDEAAKFYAPTLNGRLYHYKFQRLESMSGFEIPLRLSYICLYQEKHSPEAMREMKLHLSKLFVAVMPFIRRQLPFRTFIDDYWSNLTFPWREDMHSFHVKGLLPEYPKIFNGSGNWINEEDEEEGGDEQDEQQKPEDQNIGVPGPSTDAPEYYAASIDEIIRRTEAAGFKVT